MTRELWDKLFVAVLSVLATLAITSVAGVVRSAPNIEYRVGQLERMVREIHEAVIPKLKVRPQHGEEEDDHETRDR